MYTGYIDIYMDYRIAKRIIMLAGLCVAFAISHACVRCYISMYRILSGMWCGGGGGLEFN